MWMRRKLSHLIEMLFKNIKFKIKNPMNYWKEGQLANHSWNPPGMTEYWSGLDTPENFSKAPHPEYTATSITYTYNSNGFRTHEFDLNDLNNNILCFGCSVTEGIAVQRPWPEVLADFFPNHKTYNLGHGAASGDTVSRLVTSFVPLLKPKKVFVLWPSIYRFELYDSGVRYVGSWDEDKHLVNLLTDNNTVNWIARNKLYVRMVSKVYNFKLYEIDMEDIFLDFKKGEYYPFQDYGRDNAHPGTKSQIHIANRFYKLTSC